MNTKMKGIAVYDKDGKLRLEQDCNADGKLDPPVKIEAGETAVGIFWQGDDLILSGAVQAPFDGEVR